MRELFRTNDTVFISWVLATLADHDIPAIVLDQHTSVLEGSAGAIPRRVMVADDDIETARRIVTESGKPLPDGFSDLDDGA